MDDYKSAKEAFHAGNEGGTIWGVNAITISALSSYLLYACYVRDRRPGPVIDSITTVLPLLLGVTLFSERPYTFNALLLATAGYFFATSRTTSVGHTAVMSEKRAQKSKGAWLDESDSDEEPAEPLPSASLSVSPPPISATSSGISLPSMSTPSPSMLAPETPTDMKARKRRHSPTPSTHTHTAIDILPTPEIAGPGILANQQSSYPSPIAARARQAQTDKGKSQGKLPFLSVYRAHMMVMTFHCILAVDFSIFPRTQGKCESFGASLMDMGVGSFVFSLGVVSTKSFALSSGQNRTRNLLRSVYKATPLILLGMVRVIMVKGVEYPEHVTEYGVHWNFFFTLAMLPVFGMILWPIRRDYLRWSAIAVIIALGHEICLSKAGLLRWVLSDAREGLIGMNKEGLVSLPGYIAIYCIGLSTGEHIMRATLPPKATAVVTKSQEEHIRSHMAKRRTELALELFSYAFGWWIATMAVRVCGMDVSRRVTNLPYVLWVAAYNTTFLFGYLIIEICLSSSGSSAVPPLLEAINANGLAIFLIANLLTGLINISMRTMYIGDRTAMIVLVAYSTTLSLLAWLGRGMRLVIG